MRLPLRSAGPKAGAAGTPHTKGYILTTFTATDINTTATVGPPLVAPEPTTSVSLSTSTPTRLPDSPTATSTTVLLDGGSGLALPVDAIAGISVGVFIGVCLLILGLVMWLTKRRAAAKRIGNSSDNGVAGDKSRAGQSTHRIAPMLDSSPMELSSQCVGKRQELHGEERTRSDGSDGHGVAMHGGIRIVPAGQPPFELQGDIFFEPRTVG